MIADPRTVVTSAKDVPATAGMRRTRIWSAVFRVNAARSQDFLYDDFGLPE